ncbi:hypothetical protein [Paenibacillus polymyxa]|uniref:hypothetical protein n=1 Tax=Paenibacillus polymyxa TaxID=1406 RepID=UPI002379B1AD|nr:hypothetical protein [Paenibacillus polymyxa]WDM21283.1 hypothetical protein J4I02_20295 [Paenibacillus polymyxa]
MGQYLQMGICHQMLIEKKGIGKTKIEEIERELGKLVDLRLFDFKETEDIFSFTIMESVVKEQLQNFLKDQFALYDQSYKEDFCSVLSEVAQKQSLEQIVGLAKEMEFRFFQYSDVTDHVAISPWSRVCVETSLMLFFFEGKILMEGYNSYLRYLEKLVRASSRQAISGAFRTFIG